MRIRQIKINADVLLYACEDIGLAINTGKTKYIKIEGYPGMIPNEHIRIGTNSYEKVKALGS